MKRVFSLLISLLLALIVPLTAFADASSVQFIDKKTESTFIVPSGWKLISAEDIEYNADFCFEYQEPDEEEDEVVTYMTYSSSEFKSEDKADIADFLKIPEKKLKKAEYNRVDYYRFETKASAFTPHFGEKQKCVGYVTVSGGFIYQIMFFDSVENPVYDDFKSLMGSIEIKGTVPEAPKPQKLFTPKTIIALAVMVAALCAFVIVLIRTKK